MDDDEDDLVVSDATDDFDDVLAVLAAEAAGGFVEKENVGARNHIEADVQAFAFTAGECLFFCGADDDVAALGESEFHEAAVHAALAVVEAEVRRANRSGVGEVFFDGEVIVERVVLRDVGDEAFEFVEVFVKLLAVEKHLTARCRETACDGAEQCAFSRAAAAHHAHEVAARERETDAVERGDVAIAAEVAREIAQFE